MILTLRGCGGSGKSYVGHQLLERYPNTPIWVSGWNKPPHKKLIGYDLPGGMLLLGRYTAAGGGLDGYLLTRTRDKFYGLIDEAMQAAPFVFGESLTISSSRIWWQEFSAKNPGQVVFAFLDTPVDLCVQRILQRNGGRPIKEWQVVQHHRFIGRLAERFRAEGEIVYTIDHRHPVEDVIRIYKEDYGWQP